MRTRVAEERVEVHLDSLLLLGGRMTPGGEGRGRQMGGDEERGGGERGAGAGWVSERALRLRGGLGLRMDCTLGAMIAVWVRWGNQRLQADEARAKAHPSLP